ncbi:MAG: PQQ-dependent sugar dehydrogenase [Armatimonas sp.]
MPDVPPLSGRTIGEARLKLIPLGLKLTVDGEGSSAKPKGQIIEQNPASGTKLPTGGTVHVRISSGSDDPTLGAPNTIGKLPERGKSVLRIPKLVPAPNEHFLKAPSGFMVSLEANGLKTPRWLAIAPDGARFVVESHVERKGVGKSPNRISVLYGDQRVVWAEGLNLPFGIGFFKGFLYVANTDSVVRWPYTVGQMHAEKPAETVITGIPERGMRQHWTRNIVFSPGGNRMYLTIGSKENADVEEELRGTIVAYALDFAGRPHGKPKIITRGMRNPVGLAIHPKTGKLWAVVNERDYLGDELVPDFLTEVKEGAHYGWPWYYLGNHRDPRLPVNSALKGKVTVPDMLLPAHSAPLGLVFGRGGAWGYDAYIALHGSQNRSQFSGYCIMRVPFNEKGRPTGPPRPFVTGWLANPKHSNDVYGRPAGLAWARDGSLIITDDWGGVLWRVTEAK